MIADLMLDDLTSALDSPLAEELASKKETSSFLFQSAT
jgi:hypothetical protein